MGESNVIEALVKLGKTDNAGCFVDARLPFYSLHARQGLMVGFARAAKQIPEILAPHKQFFIHYALNDQPHILIRHFSALAAVEISNSTKGSIDDSVLTKLKAVNKSQFPPVPLDHSKRYKAKGQQKKSKNDGGAKRFTFSADIAQYFFSGLAECFAKTINEIEIQAEQVIWDDWGLTSNGYYDNDPRTKLRLYNNNSNYHSHSSFPKSDDLNFYLSYHAMMVTAGKLLDNEPLYQDPSYEENEFNEWFNRYLLSRSDGGWLADRRDPQPLEWPSWKDEKFDDHWAASVGRTDFEKLLQPSRSRLNIWGDWLVGLGNKEEDITIRSALVSSQNSFALLKALQTSKHCHDYSIPQANDSDEIDEAPFQLKGWVEDNAISNRLDGFDPWANKIRCPPICPAPFLVKQAALTSNNDMRTWSINPSGKEVYWSENWSEQGKNYDDEYQGQYGRRLQVDFEFIQKYLTEANCDLIIKVEIRRKTRHNRYETRTNREFEYLEPYAKIFILNGKGQIISLYGSS
jgi:hypothetical protein